MQTLKDIIVVGALVTGALLLWGDRLFAIGG